MQNPSSVAGAVPGPWGSQGLATELANLPHGGPEKGEPAVEVDTVGGDVRPDGTFDFAPREQTAVTALARTMSRYSAQTAHSADTKVPHNPILDKSDPTLDPHSDAFDARKWARQLFTLATHGPTELKMRTAGVSFKNLSVYGFGSATDYQADVGNVWFKALEGLRTRLGLGRQRRIDILRNFDGLVRSGEMLVVLGRPGRYVALSRSGVLSDLLTLPQWLLHAPEDHCRRDVRVKRKRARAEPAVPRSVSVLWTL